ncbi:replicative DNA helicase [Veillonella sp. R32]|uniref:replicative DNA helicase n=1 Tax=Veillonella sp. R32 TaxID=2021312 RepID=UPI0013897848|nr:replicative DNA helicase [Veillonella sp. R32]KAF1682556.1 replicative DNA helicase [Veillonella sp. R32]
MAEPRIPPHSIDAERAVLGALLTGENVYDTISSIVTRSDFYRDAHRIIFEAIENIQHSHQRPDMVLLVEELKRLNKLDEVGGINYITDITNASSATYNVEEHARIVAGKAQLRRLIDAGNKIVGESYASDKSVPEILNDAEVGILGVTGQLKAETSFVNLGDVLPTIITRLGELQNHGDTLTGISTGFRDLDRVTNGLQRSDLILVAARPSMGKTAFTLNLAYNVAVKGKGSVAFFSLEMSAEQLVGRILSSATEIHSDKLRTGQLQPEDWNKVASQMGTLLSSQLYIDDTPGLTVQMMRSKLRRLKVEKGLDLIIVDYVQLMTGRNGGNSDNRQQEISEISRNLKLIAREMNVPLIALSQLSRGVESRTDKRPVLSDLRESGSLEQDADIVIFLYRDKYYSKDDTQEDITEVIIRKHRNGALGTINLLFQGELTRFRDTTLRTEDDGM